MNIWHLNNRELILYEEISIARYSSFRVIDHDK